MGKLSALRQTKVLSLLLTANLAIFGILIPAPANAATSSFNCGGGGTYTVVDGVVTTSANCVGAVIIDNSVTSIADHAFNGNTGDANYKNAAITALTVPSSVTSIGNYAFRANPIRSLNLNEGLLTIGAGAFSEMNIQSFWLDVTIPDSVTSMGNGTFSQSFLGHVVVGDGLATIPEGAFYNNYDGGGALSVSLGSGVRTIGLAAFLGFRGTELVIPDGVETIENRAFQGLGSSPTISYLSLPSTITRMDAVAYDSQNPDAERLIFIGRTAITNINYCGSNSAVLNYEYPPNSGSPKCLVKITYKANGGFGADVFSYAELNAPSTLRSNTFFKSGSSIAGWTENQDGSGQVFADGSQQTFTTAKTLYAKWQASTAPLTKQLNWDCQVNRSGQVVFVPITSGLVEVTTTNCDHIEVLDVNLGTSYAFLPTYFNDAESTDIKVFSEPYSVGDRPVVTFRVMVADPALAARPADQKLNAFGWNSSSDNDYGQVPAAIDLTSGAFEIVPAGALEPAPAGGYEWEGAGYDSSTEKTWLLTGVGCEIWELNTATGVATKAYDLATTTGVAMTYCNAMMTNNDGTAYVRAWADPNSPLVKISLADGSLVPGFSSIDLPDVNGIAQDPTTGKIWVVSTANSGNGLYELNLDNGDLSNYIPFDWVWDIAFDENGTVWMADWGGSSGLECGMGCYSYLTPSAQNPLLTMGSLGQMYHAITGKYHTSDAIWFGSTRTQQNQNNQQNNNDNQVIIRRKVKFVDGNSATQYEIINSSAPSAPLVLERVGYKFLGWKLTPTSSQVVDLNSMKITEDTTLHAAWAREIYTVRLVTGSIMKATKLRVGYLGNLLRVKAPTKKGYVFAGWRIGSPKGELLKAGTPIKGDVNLYASWKRK